MLTSDRRDVLKGKGVEPWSISWAVPEKTRRVAAQGSVALPLEVASVAVVISPEVAERPRESDWSEVPWGPQACPDWNRCLNLPKIGSAVRSTRLC